MTKRNSEGPLRLMGVIDNSDSRRLRVLIFWRVLANGLDVLGILGVALLANAVGSAISNEGLIVVTLPSSQIVLGESGLLLAASILLLLFLAKSAFSVWLNLRTSLLISRIETELSTWLVKKHIGEAVTTSDSGLAEVQTQSIDATLGLRLYLNARLVVISETVLLLSICSVFAAINIYATVAIAAVVGIVHFVLNGLLMKRVERNSERQIFGAKRSLDSIRDAMAVKVESASLGTSDFLVSRFRKARSEMASGAALTYTLQSMPRYIVETSLLIGIALLFAGVILFSDVASQATTIAVFLAGGLRLIGALVPLQNALAKMREGLTKAETALMALEANSDDVDSQTLPHEQFLKPNLIEFKEASFSYPGAESRAIDDVSFSIEPFSLVAVVGPSGAGKSTLFDLASGFLRPTVGSVMIGGYQSRDVRLQSPGYIGFVPQKPNIIRGTILENVALRDHKQVDQELVKKILTDCMLGNSTAKPDWAETKLDPDLNNLSGGELQRLSIARALYQRPKILFLDEATSAMDSNLEAQLNELLETLRQSMTVVVIAHRLSTVENASKIIYLENGRVTTSGTFSQLQQSVPEFSKAIKRLAMKTDRETSD